MKSRGIFAIVSALVAGIGSHLKGAFATHSSGNTSGRISNGRQAFYAVSAPHRANQRKNYAKGWAR